MRAVIALDSMAGFVRSLSSARDIVLSSYTLHPGPVLGALEAAARHGAAVRLRLNGDPVGGPAGKLHRDNIAAVAELRAAGADAALTGPDDPAMHIKAATVDGVTWLDDRNWIGSSAERIVRTDDPREIAMTKADALQREADVIERAGAAPLDVESESFGSGLIYAALLRRAQAHLTTRLIVAGREAAEPRNAAERTCLARLAHLGVDVRTGNARSHDLNEKLAVTSGAAWVGSANATYAGGDYGAQSDWGVASSDAALVHGLRDAFAQNWARAEPIVASP
jgi:hypothetical protein